jgi:hypothetical protein
MSDNSINEKLNKIFSEILKSFKPRLDKIENHTKNFEMKMQTFEKRIMNKVKSDCSQQYNHLLEKGVISEGPEGIKMDVKDNSSETMRIVNDFQRCADNTVRDVKDFMAEMNESQNEIYSKNEKCLSV